MINLRPFPRPFYQHGHDVFLKPILQESQAAVDMDVVPDLQPMI
jgi:hypothetical protein